MNTRREFLSAFLISGSVSLLQVSRLTAQSLPGGQGQGPAQRPGQPFPDQPKEDDAQPSKAATKAILEENDKDIKKSVEKLYQLAGELKAEVEKTDSAKVLSLEMLRKAEEIEKLAREIKNRAKG